MALSVCRLALPLLLLISLYLTSVASFSVQNYISHIASQPSSHSDEVLSLPGWDHLLPSRHFAGKSRSFHSLIRAFKFP